MEKIDSISTAPLFSGLSEEQQQELAAILLEKTVDKGEQIFLEGDEATGFYIIASGQVKVYKLSPDGKEQILHIFDPGEPFAEVAVFTGSTYPAHAMALKKSRLLFFPRQAFKGLIGSNPSLAMNMMASMSQRLKKFAHMIEALSLKEVPSRLASHLLYLSAEQNHSDEICLNIPKGQLASLLGTIPETLSRILAKMGKQGFIRSQGNKVTILDFDSLEDLAEGEIRL